jgi:ribokinase
VRDRDTARTAARWLLDRGVRAAVIQAGGGGDLMVWRDTNDHEWWLPHFAVHAVDATGAGDAFAAALPTTAEVAGFLQL